LDKKSEHKRKKNSIDNFQLYEYIRMMNFRNNNNKILSLILLGSFAFILAVAEREEQKQFLRRKAPELCTPFFPRQSVEESFTYIVLEFENRHNNSLHAPYVNGTQIAEIYNNLVDCRKPPPNQFEEQFGAIRGISNTNEFMPKALPVEEEDILDFPKVLIEIGNFYCNSCGINDFKLFYDPSDLAGAEDIQAPNVCDCRGPSRRDFIAKLIDELELTNLKNVTQIPLLHPKDCDPISATSFSYAGVCPGSDNRKFDFFTYPPTSNPTTAPSNPPTNEPTTEAPTNAPTDFPTEKPTRRRTRRPTPSPTRATENPTTAPTGAPTFHPTITYTGSPTTAPTGAPTLHPTITYTGSPTISPTGAPTLHPTITYTGSPTSVPTTSPTSAPTESQYPSTLN